MFNKQTRVHTNFSTLCYTFLLTLETIFSQFCFLYFRRWCVVVHFFIFLNLFFFNFVSDKKAFICSLHSTLFDRRVLNAQCCVGWFYKFRIFHGISDVDLIPFNSFKFSSFLLKIVKRLLSTTIRSLRMNLYLQDQWGIFFLFFFLCDLL